MSDTDGGGSSVPYHIAIIIAALPEVDPERS